MTFLPWVLVRLTTLVVVRGTCRIDMAVENRHGCGKSWPWKILAALRVRLDSGGCMEVSMSSSSSSSSSSLWLGLQNSSHVVKGIDWPFGRRRRRRRISHLHLLLLGPVQQLVRCIYLGLLGRM